MRTRKPITRNWPSPDELAEVDQGIRKLVATLEPSEPSAFGSIANAIFRKRSVLCRPSFERIRAPEIDRPEPGDGRRENRPDLVSTTPPCSPGI